ncbi:MAG: dehydrogenase [Planctomycetaceae bacterium]|nr:dehydrogenase [Planctomycetaceae bacterium]|tara:strand:- start:21 stop:4439 length:4419 start_codon:yes stop_codon:yes gene_type:complete
MRRFVFSFFLFFFSFATVQQIHAQVLDLPQAGRIAVIGNNLADRMQHQGWLESYIQAIHPKHKLSFRHLGFTGDEVNVRPRSNNFGSADQWLTKVQADVVFCFFGYNEALKGPDQIPALKQNLAVMIDGMLQQRYNGESAPTLVVFSPLAHENLHSPHLPNGELNNQNLAAATAAMAEVCKSKNIRFVDIFTTSLSLYKAARKPLTLNGVHLLDHGADEVAKVIINELFAMTASQAGKRAHIERIRDAVLERNYYWFSRYRVVDGYNVYGGRSTLNWFGQSNADVMKREMEIFDVMTGNRDELVWAYANGNDFTIKDDNLPDEMVVQTNKPGSLDGGMHPYLKETDAISKMTIAEGMQVNLFASEAEFPELVNPVQMCVDPNGVLYASVWPSYPHWNPTQPRTDRILAFPDKDADGKADECIVFADKLNSITGIEFWGGGMLVAAPPEIWFLKDTDGDMVADEKIRMLQGVSSADTHHSANAFVIGPDGGLYWSRGIFNVANMETPTKTYRSTASGVYRFDPRTFEMEFVFPIGPNPHGDAFDQWGFQFANDGTGGTGSYVNIGKGMGNKKWFKKRVRPVAATGFLSSSHFPEANNGNFLICNVIGFQGVLQHEVKYEGADITAEEIEPILYSSDPTFRPSDIEVGGDGALYVSDWSNALIGHMQHNMRDPNRDAKHGRIYRVTYKGRPLVNHPQMIGAPVADILQSFLLPENGIRYRARLELSGREADATLATVAQWAKSLEPGDSIQAQALLECLWVFEEQRVANLELLQRVFEAQDGRHRAAAIRTLGHWAGKIDGWEALLTKAAQDESALVRAEVAKAAVELQGLAAAEAIFEVAVRPTDAELTTVLNYATKSLNVDAIVNDAIANNKPLSKAAQLYVLRNASIEDLMKLDPTEAVYLAILARENANAQQLSTAITGLSQLQQTEPAALIVELLAQRDTQSQSGIAGLGTLLTLQPAEQLAPHANTIEKLAVLGQSADTRRYAFAAWIAADGTGDDAYLAATRSKEQLRDFLSAIPAIRDEQVRSNLYSKVLPLVSALPTQLESESGGASLAQPGIHVDFYQPSIGNVDINNLNKLTPKESGVADHIGLDVPQRKAVDAFALKFSGYIRIDQPGRYTFGISSDDGSRVYINDAELINNDGLHGPILKSAAIDLAAGSHKLEVTYFDNGGGDALSFEWSGPGIKKQPIPENRLSVTSGETIHDFAIHSLASIPGHEEEKFNALIRLLKAGLQRTSSINALSLIPSDKWPEQKLQPLADNLVAYLTELPAAYRTSDSATQAINLTKAVAVKLPDLQRKAVENRLQNLDVRVIAVGTVAHRMIYDKEQLVIETGKTVEFRFSNTDSMPHNFVITTPGAMQEIGELAEATGRDPDAMARHYVPRSDKVLLSSTLLQTNQVEALIFEAPQEPGIYPYVCTYPGHWRRMYGALYVVADAEQYNLDPEKYLADNKLEYKDDLLKLSSRGRQWKVE